MHVELLELYLMCFDEKYCKPEVDLRAGSLITRQNWNLLWFDEFFDQLEKVLKVNDYLADLADYHKMNEVYRGRFGENPPVRTTVATYGGVPGDSLVEIDCARDKNLKKCRSVENSRSQVVEVRCQKQFQKEIFHEIEQKKNGEKTEWISAQAVNYIVWYSQVSNKRTQKFG